MMRPLLRLVVASVLCTAPALPAQGGPGRPIGADDPRIDSVFRFVKSDAPGCAVGVYRRGELTWARGYGLASLEHAVPIAPSTVFDLGSTSKQFTAALTLLMVQDGLVALDDKVRKHVPELPAWGDSITVRQLLHHTAGVRDYLTIFGLGSVFTEDFTTQQEAVEAIARQRRLDFVPGSDFSYSNSGYLLLAEIVSRRSGKSFGTLARERLFEPLGMRQSVVMERHTQLMRGKAGSYAPSAEGFDTEWSDFEQVGDGAVHSSLEDLAHWVSNYERPTVGGEKLVRELELTGQLAKGSPISYARGLMVDSLRGLRRVRHGGAWVGFRSDLVRFPDRQLALAALCNRGDANPEVLLNAVSEFILDDLGVPRASAVAASGNGSNSAGAVGGQSEAGRAGGVKNAARYAGTYFSLSTGRSLRVFARGDTLLGEFGPTQRVLRAQQSGGFSADGLPVVLMFGAPSSGNGEAIMSMNAVMRGGTPDSMLRIDPSAVHDAGMLESLPGDWRSDELDVTWHVRADSAGGLQLLMPRREPQALRALMPGIMRAGSLIMHTTRDNAGVVRSFTVSAGRAKGMEFKRQR